MDPSNTHLPAAGQGRKEEEEEGEPEVGLHNPFI